MNIKITHFHFEEIINSGYTLDMIYMLKLVDDGFDIQSLRDNAKIDILCQSLIRKGLITDTYKITLIGKSILGFLDEEGESPKIKKRPKTTDFDDWWKTYPGTDTFTYKGQSFTGSRSIRVKKEDCKTKFDAILAEGEYTSKDMIAALEFEITQKKENSIKTKSNRMTFMQNSLTYLNQRTFEPFIELIREGGKVEEAPTVRGGTDI